MNFLNRLKNIRNKTKKFKFNTRNRNNNNFNNYNKYINIKTPNNKARLLIGLRLRNNSIHYVVGETNKNVRRKGYGTLLRAIPILAAKNTRYKKVYHSAIFMNNNQKRNYNVPPSLRIVRSLGFQPTNVNMYSELNLSKANYNKISHIVFK